jgi:arylsulfatase A-like enzyme
MVPTMRGVAYDADAQTAAMQEWLRSRSPDRPFLGVLACGPPHNPYRSAPRAWQERFAPEHLALRGNVRPEDAARVRPDLAGYYAHIGALDAAFGRLDATLHAIGAAERTIVVFTSDHGDLLGSHGLWDKQGPWDEALRIPCLMRGPGLPGGARDGRLLDLVDLWPTLAGLAGLPAPGGLHGLDRSHHLRQGTSPADDAALYASYHVFGNWPRQACDPAFAAREARGLRTARHTYVEDRAGAWLLYDDEDDPCQLRNLATEPAQAGLRRELAGRLRRLLADCGDDFVSGAELVHRFGWRLQANGNVAMAGWRG